MSDQYQELLAPYRLVEVTTETHERLAERARQLGITVEELVEQALANVGAN